MAPILSLKLGPRQAGAAIVFRYRRLATHRFYLWVGAKIIPQPLPGVNRDKHLWPGLGDRARLPGLGERPHKK